MFLLAKSPSSREHEPQYVAAAAVNMPFYEKAWDEDIVQTCKYSNVRKSTPECKHFETIFFLITVCE